MNQLVVSKRQVRTRDVEKGLEDLVDNIRVHGQLEPIIVAPVESDGETFEIIAGQRRWLAMRKLQQETILAAILDRRLDEATAQVLSVSENLIREDLSSKDLIDACTALYRKYGSAKAVAEELGLPYATVRNYVKFDRLRPELKDLVESGQLEVKTALRIEDHYGDEQVEATELQRTVQAVSGMTGAQQVDYFKDPQKHATSASEPAGHTKASLAPPGRAGSVRQIIVTLRTEDHEKLRDWAASRGLGQDKAAAWILNAYLRTVNIGTGRGVTANGAGNGVTYPVEADG